MISKKKSIRAYCWKSLKATHLKRAIKFGVVAKNGNQESLTKNQLVIVHDKDDQTGTIKVALAKGLGTLAINPFSYYWPQWKASSKSILVHKVKFITKIYTLPNGFFQRKYTTQTNMDNLAKSAIVKWILSDHDQNKLIMENHLK